MTEKKSVQSLVIALIIISIFLLCACTKTPAVTPSGESIATSGMAEPSSSGVEEPAATAFTQPYIIKWSGSPIWEDLKEEYGWNQSTTVEVPELQMRIRELVGEREITSVSQVTAVSKIIAPHLSKLTDSAETSWLLMEASLEDQAVWCLWYLEASLDRIDYLERVARNESVPGVYDAGLLVYISAMDGHLIGIEGFPQISVLSDNEAEYTIKGVVCPPDAMFFPMLCFEEHLKAFAKKHEGYGNETSGKEDRFPDEALQEALAAATAGKSLQTPEAAANYAFQICNVLIGRGYLEQAWSPELLYFYTDDVVRVTIRPETPDKVLNEGWELCFSTSDGHIISIYYVDIKTVYSISPSIRGQVNQGTVLNQWTVL